MNKNFVKSGLLALSFLLFVLSAPVFVSAQDTAPFLGNWKGAISIVGQELEIIVHFQLDESKNMTGTIDVPAQGASGLPLSDIKIEGNSISFLISGIPGDPTFSGQLDKAGNKISGKFSQSNMEGTFSLDKQ